MQNAQCKHILYINLHMNNKVAHRERNTITTTTSSTTTTTTTTTITTTNSTIPARGVFSPAGVQPGYQGALSLSLYIYINYR